MRIRLESPTLVDDLMRALGERSDVVVHRVSECEVEAALIGSYHDGGEAELGQIVRAWRESRGGGGLHVVR